MARPSLNVRANVTIANNKIKGEPHNFHEGSVFPSMIQGVAEEAKDVIVRLV